MNKSSESYRFLNIIYQGITNKEYRHRLVRTMTHPACHLVDSPGGANPENMYYYIHDNDSYGFFALWRFAMTSLDFADEMGLTPFISWMGQPLYSEKDPINGTRDPFLYFFKQPAGIDFAKLKKCKKVIRAKHSGNRTKYPIFSDYDLYDDQRRFNRLVYLQRKYMQYNEATSKRLDSDFKSITNGFPFIGVHIRGTDYKLELINHPASITTEEYISETEKAVEKTGIRKIFLATDDEMTLSLFRNRFGEQCITYADAQRSSSKVGVHFLESTREHHRYLLGYEVLRDVYTLSRADSFIGGVSNVSLAARVFAEATGNNFRECRVLYHGISNVDSQEKKRRREYNSYREKIEKKLRRDQGRI